jgi:hypothetical protein
MERRLPDISKISNLTGWRPTRTLDDIVHDVIGHETRSLALERRMVG